MKTFIKQVMFLFLIGVFILAFLCVPTVYSLSDAYKNNIYNPGIIKPTDSILKLKVGDRAPDFTLKAVSGEMISLKQYRGKKNVVISFVPAALQYC
jgi:cytochrome oxidase Cu insertion factor (SCO1/SenC/PrrC family)